MLPFTGLYANWGGGGLRRHRYVTAYFNNRVVKLAAGASAQQVLPFTGLAGPSGVAVDSAGTVYVTDYDNNRVVQLAAGSSAQQVLPFTGLNSPPGWRWIPPAPSTSSTRATIGW